jgi:hypothetical protein
MNTVPEHLPRLRHGAHLHSTDGACLMEYVSVLAGEPWSDQPRCTHPALAAVARAVNDALGQAARDRAALLAPELARSGSGDPHTTPRLVLACTAMALRIHPGSTALRRHQRRAVRRLAQEPRRPAWLRAAGDRMYRRGPAMHALAATVRSVLRRSPDPDTALLDLLAVAIAAVNAPPKCGHSGVLWSTGVTALHQEGLRWPSGLAEQVGGGYGRCPGARDGGADGVLVDDPAPADLPAVSGGPAERG